MNTKKMANCLNTKYYTEITLKLRRNALVRININTKNFFYTYTNSWICYTYVAARETTLHFARCNPYIRIKIRIYIVQLNFVECFFFITTKIEQIAQSLGHSYNIDALRN